MPGFSSPNYTQTPNDFYDVYLPLMGLAEIKVVSAIMRLTFGYHREKQTTTASLNTLVKLTGLSVGGVLLGIKKAESRGLIQRVNKGNGRRQVLIWKILFSDATTSPGEVVAADTTSPGEVVLPHGVRQTTSRREALLNKTERKTKKPLTTAAALKSSQPGEPGPQPAAAAVGHADWWSLPVLVAAGKFPRKRAAGLSAANPSPGAYVSKYLYALSKSGFKAPGLWAASQVETNPDAWEGEPYETLAALGPRGLAEVLAWLRDDMAYPLNLNGATGAALKLAADLKDKHKKDPARAYVAAADALADLGLARLAQPADVAELAAAEPAPAAPRPAADAWAAFLDNLIRVEPLPGPALERLRRGRLVSFEGGRYAVAVPTRHELDWLNARFTAFTKRHPVTFSLQEAA